MPLSNAYLIEGNAEPTGVFSYRLTCKTEKAARRQALRALQKMIEEYAAEGADAFVYHGFIKVASYVWTRPGGLVEEVLDNQGEVVAVEPRSFPGDEAAA